MAYRIRECGRSEPFAFEVWDTETGEALKGFDTRRAAEDYVEDRKGDDAAAQRAEDHDYRRR